MRRLCLAVLTACLSAQEPFLVAPYLQLGDAPRVAPRESLELLWHSEDQDGDWTVEVRLAGAWKAQGKPAFRRMDAPPLPPHRIWRATLRNLPPGATVPYRVMLAGKAVFQAEAKTRKPGAHRMVVFADIADGSREQAAIAKAVHGQSPDAVLVAGDIVYPRGRAAEYRKVFYPVYNLEAVPLLRSTPVLSVPGNHDVPFPKHADAAAYFAYWSMPLNGPARGPAEPSAAPMVPGVHDGVVAAAGPAYPRMGSYSFDYGQVHWTVLDSNVYADWENPTLQAWLEADLKGAQGATWRFVALHHPLFQSSRTHLDDQWMRVISPLLEQYGVSLVFAGHVHNYQRSAPIRFKPTKVGTKGRPVEGEFQVDEAFDGVRVTRAKAPIHIVTGAGGAELYDRWQTDAKASWQPWTRTFISDRHSFTVLDVAGRTVKLRQLDAEGRELDAITLTK